MFVPAGLWGLAIRSLKTQKQEAPVEELLS
jgi:hypothetical protein